MSRCWRGLVCASLLALGCANPGADRWDDAPLAPVHGLTGVPAEYLPAFEAVRAAVAVHEDATARRILERTLAMMEADREAFWQEMDSRERRGLDSAFALARGFGRILDGRERVAALTLVLEVESDQGEHALSLAVESSWAKALALRPGPPTLCEELVWVTPMGRENRVGRYLAVEELETLEVAANGRTRLPLARSPFRFPPEALAASWRWSLQLRSGGVRDDEGPFPAMGWSVAPVVHTALAAFLPDSPVEPAELAAYLEQDLGPLPPERSLPAIMERAVRIPVERRDEALALLAPLIEGATAEEIRRMVPALRWLSGTDSPGGDPLAWREWMRGREASERDALSGAAPGRRPGPLLDEYPAVDLPRRR